MPANKITDGKLTEITDIYPINTPSAKEAFYYRTVFEELSPRNACEKIVPRWAPQLDWGYDQAPPERAAYSG